MNLIFYSQRQSRSLWNDGREGLSKAPPFNHKKEGLEDLVHGQNLLPRPPAAHKVFLQAILGITFGDPTMSQTWMGNRRWTKAALPWELKPFCTVSSTIPPITYTDKYPGMFQPLQLAIVQLSKPLSGSRERRGSSASGDSHTSLSGSQIVDHYFYSEPS